MKKVLSLILAVCMLASFAMVASAAAANPATIKLDVTETENTVVAKVIFAGTFSSVGAFDIFVDYDETNLEFTSSSFTPADYGTQWVDKSAVVSERNNTTNKAYRFTANDNNSAAGYPDYISGTDKEMTTLVFTKIGTNATYDVNSVVILPTFKVNVVASKSLIKCTDPDTNTVSTTNYTADIIDTDNFTAYVPAVTNDPAVTTESADVSIVTDAVADGTANYTVTVAAKFGKKATVYANGEVISAGVEYAATADTVITVEYVDDGTAAVYAYTKAYSAAGEGAVFAKATNGATDCGFIIEAFRYKNFNNGYYANDAKFVAENVVDGVFGIMITGVDAGSYEAVPYAGADTGAAVNLVVE